MIFFLYSMPTRHVNVNIKANNFYNCHARTHHHHCLFIHKVRVYKYDRHGGGGASLIYY